MNRIIVSIITVLLCALLAIGIWGRLTISTTDGTPEDTVNETVEPAEEPEETAEPTEEPSEEPEETAAAVDESAFTDTDSLLLVANKVHKLPEGYEPEDLVNVNDYGGHGTIAPYMRLEAAEALAEMTEAAMNEAGIYLSFSSAYRSESYQASLYNGYVAKYGVETADTISSRPGYSDHQTGLACDFIEGGDADFTEDFEYTSSGEWLRENAHRFGFIMRYPKGKDDTTGYAYEPWHFRYVGVDTATAIYNVDEYESFEEYFNVAGGTVYEE